MTLSYNQQLMYFRTKTIEKISLVYEKLLSSIKATFQVCHIPYVDLGSLVKLLSAGSDKVQIVLVITVPPQNTEDI